MAKYEDLPCKLDDDEVLDRTKKMLDSMQHEEDLEVAFAKTKERHKEEATAASYETQSLRRVISAREEVRQVEIVENSDYKKGIVEVLRVDTNEVVLHRPMTELERQSPLFKAHEKRGKKKDDEEPKGETQ